MKLIVAGGRSLQWGREHVQMLASWMRARGVTLEISGCAGDAGLCVGADILGEVAADSIGVEVRRFPVTKADWDRLGKKAGPLRNRQMAQIADAVLLLPGGRGTQSMYDEAKSAGLVVFDNRNSKGWQR